MISAVVECELAAATRFKTAWGKVCQLPHLLSNWNLSLLTRGQMCSTCVRSVHIIETRAMTVATRNRLRCNDQLDLLCQGEG